MLPVWIAAFFGALLMAYVAVSTPQKQAVVMAVAADVDATNFVAYRRAVQAYMAANPGATGTIDDSALAAYWLPGYVRDPNWTNLVSGGALYVYSSSAVASSTLDALHSKAPGNLLIGAKSATTGRLQSYNGIDTGITLPVAIPNQAIVMIGQ